MAVPIIVSTLIIFLQYTYFSYKKEKKLWKNIASLKSKMRKSQIDFYAFFISLSFYMLYIKNKLQLRKTAEETTAITTSLFENH